MNKINKFKYTHSNSFKVIFIIIILIFISITIFMYINISKEIKGYIPISTEYNDYIRYNKHIINIKYSKLDINSTIYIDEGINKIHRYKKYIYILTDKNNLYQLIEFKNIKLITNSVINLDTGFGTLNILTKNFKLIKFDPETLITKEEININE